MASRRKASTPCMIRPDRTLVQMDDDSEESQHMETSPEQPLCDVAAEADNQQNQPPSEPLDLADDPERPPATPDPERPPATPDPERPPATPDPSENLNAFKEHVDASHPNVILNPLYLCAACNFNTKKFDSLTEHNEKIHPGEVNFKFKRVKLNNQTILEQTIEGCGSNGANPAPAAVRNGEEPGGLGKSATIAGARFARPKVLASSDVKRTNEFQLGSLTSELKKPVTAVNGTVLIPEATLLKVPKIAVPLNTTKYNPSLDGNLTLMSSFNKFPYPTQAELSWLTAASKHPEEQIKVWFTTQRLKQGISWSPEEVEEARKKMFNGTIASSPAQTFTSLPCHLLGQTSLVLTPVVNGSTVTCAPLALTLTNQMVQSLKRPLSSPVIATGIKRPSIIQTIQVPVAAAVAAKAASPKLLSFTVDPNKTAKQLSLLRHSYTQCPFPEEDEIYRLIETTGLSRGEIKTWFSEQRLLNIKGAPPPPGLVKAEPPALPKERAVPSHFPLLERVKGKSSEQLTALEESFQRSGRPTQDQLDQLARDTKLSQTEVDCWFSERRALRDNMEKALLNLGAVPRVGAAPRVGTARRVGTPPATAVEKEGEAPGPQVFSRTQWPSPEEYSQLEVQTGLGRTDIVRWFKDHRALLKNGQTLDWMEGYQQQKTTEQPAIAAPEQNGRSAEKQQSAVQQEARILKEGTGEAEATSERSKLSGPNLVQWFTDRLGHSVSDLSRARADQADASIDPADKERWVKVVVAVGEESDSTAERQKLTPDAEMLALEQPGAVTG
ncbi:hypothetical protein NHX12_001601 [Muraenolepis orangiensis]|uniref:Zinc fingers and homeoboxes 2 n=1 Tax=Muraenolepis orangiensis TaxID=630683 RepID=A0A9Q0E037_9TELE|nr:hypothetical protein NHX12_001601 [Muraenolepis orangiensis]